MSPAAPAGTPETSRFSIPASVEAVLLFASLFWMLTANRLFFGAALAERSGTEASTWVFGAALGVALVALHFLLLAPWLNRWTLKPLLGLLTVVTAFAAFFMQRYSVFLDPSMLRNVLRTDVHEASELFTWSLLPHLLLYAVLPLLLLWRVRLKPRPWKRALLVRLGSMVAALLVLAATVMAAFQPLSSLMRNHKEVRYLITPANYLWSLASVAGADSRAAAGPRQVIGEDAQPGPTWTALKRPRLVVLVVGETARAANWGLNGYARQTTPELAQLPVISFTDVGSCGTNTEVSLPCMFAPVGRRNYDEARIRHSETLLHVVARAGVAVHWRDNQSGCKGVCDGLPNDTVESLKVPGLCADGRCLDEGLLQGLEGRLDQAKGVQLLVMHQLGNHGPSYFRRYPPAFARFQPACEQDDLRLCSIEQIVNAYDNALLYTDHVVAELIRRLQAAQDRVDSAVIYVSDHGESLGEKNLFLHGVPYAIAPDVQTKVPMLMWLSPGFGQALSIDSACLQRRAREPASHDHLFHTVMGLLDVNSRVREASLDLTAACRGAAAAAGSAPASDGAASR